MAKQIKLVKSLSGRKKDQVATANSLGLKKIGDVLSERRTSARELDALEFAAFGDVLPDGEKVPAVVARVGGDDEGDGAEAFAAPGGAIGLRQRDEGRGVDARLQVFGVVQLA